MSNSQNNNCFIVVVNMDMYKRSVESSGPDLSVWRPWAGSLLEAPIPTLECYKLLALAIVKTDWWGAGVVVCLEQGADNSIFI